MKRYETYGVEVKLHEFLILTTDRGDGQFNAPAAKPLGKGPWSPLDRRLSPRTQSLCGSYTRWGLKLVSSAIQPSAVCIYSELAFTEM